MDVRFSPDGKRRLVPILRRMPTNLQWLLAHCCRHCPEYARWPANRLSTAGESLLILHFRVNALVTRYAHGMDVFD
jgi:hypothetical protein